VIAAFEVRICSSFETQERRPLRPASSPLVFDHHFKVAGVFGMP